MVKTLITITILSISIVLSTTKIYKNRCELARELVVHHKIDKNESSKWTCIADKLNADLNTNKTSKNQDSIGIFAIRKQFWCSDTSAEESRCGITCDKLLDDDITDDLSCVRDVINSEKTYRREFEAWPVYAEFCQQAWKDYLKACFGGKKPGKARQGRMLYGNSLEQDLDEHKLVEIGAHWDSFGPEPDYLLNEMFSDQPKRLKRIN